MHKYTSLLLALLPLAALASGGDVLVSVWSELALFASVILSLLITRFTLKAKAIIFVVYFAAAAMVNLATWNMPYSSNQTFIVAVSLLVPGVCWLAALALMHHRREKHSNALKQLRAERRRAV